MTKKIFFEPLWDVSQVDPFHTTEKRGSMKNILKVSKEVPSKIYRDSPSLQAISNMKKVSKSALNTRELLSDLFILREGIKGEVRELPMKTFKK